MCIIIAKDKKSRIPTEKELKNSFEYNNDGAGFMYVDNNKVVIDIIITKIFISSSFNTYNNLS